MPNALDALRVLREELERAEERVQYLRQAVHFLEMAQRTSVEPTNQTTVAAGSYGTGKTHAMALAGEAASRFRLPLEGASTKDAVMNVLSEDLTGTWRLQPLVAEMQRRGWSVDSDDPEAVVRTALNRLKAEERVERRGYGLYGAKPSLISAAVQIARGLTARPGDDRPQPPSQGELVARSGGD